MTYGPAPHPGTCQPYVSPVAPGTGWPGDPATVRTPRARNADDVRRLARSARSLQMVDARSSVCRACPRLVEWRERVAMSGRRAAFADEPYWGRPTPGYGDPAPRLLVVGLAPAANGGNRTGRMFTGDRSGDWIYAALYRAGYARVPWTRFAGDGQQLTAARMVASVRCAPPDNKPLPSERDTCAGWLDRELELVTPTLRVVLALGAFGFDAFLASARRLGWTVPRPRPKFGHGAEVTLRTPTGSAVQLLASYHVSQQNTFTGKLTEDMLDAVLTRARALTHPGAADAVEEDADMSDTARGPALRSTGPGEVR
jgi:uracil-DNA glycosylase family 4